MFKRAKRSRPRGTVPYFAVETLESRILYSADLPAAIDAPDDPVPSETRQVQVTDADARAADKVESSGPRELVIVDAGLEDVDSLVADLQRDAKRSIEIILIDRDEDAIARISEALAGHSALDALHIVSHGEDARLYLGRDSLNLMAVLGQAESVSGWSKSFTAGADLLIYGCDLASSDAGRNLADTLANLTGLDVAASIDATGARDLGGDWRLEYTRGNIQSDIAFSERLQEDYAGSFATFTVSNLNDSGGGSLRQAILNSNATGTDDLIQFGVAGSINLFSQLPSITDKVTIDGTTAPGYTNAPVVTLNGSATTYDIGLFFANGSDGSEVRGLMIVDFDLPGIYAVNAHNLVIAGNYLGTDGTTDRGNSVGLDLTQSRDAIVGGSTPAERNVISGNTRGIELYGSGSTGHQILGNYLGVNASGTSAIGNSVGIIVLNDASNNVIGGSFAGEGNLISGNSQDGISIQDSGVDGNVIIGNYIGTEVSGTGAIANGDEGISVVNGATNTRIGGSAVGERNVISGNGGSGINVHGGGTNGTSILGNYIGTDASGISALANTQEGIKVNNGADDTTIGGNAAGDGNVISSNGFDGILVDESGTDGTTIIGNRIGTTEDGSTALGNTGNGVAIMNGATNTIVGGDFDSGFGNVLSGNFTFGVLIDGSGTTGNEVRGNLIGTDAGGTVDLGNAFTGVMLSGGTSSNTIGGYRASGLANVISGNGTSGLTLDGAGTGNNLVEGNLIGTDVNGTSALGNDIHGILVEGGTGPNTVGTTGNGNIISGNAVDGIRFENGTAGGNTITGNYIGTDATGTVALGNGHYGIKAYGFANNMIGGTASGAGNVVSGNGFSGIEIYDTASSGNTIHGNRIGTNAAGTAALGNGAFGLLLSGPNNIIGGGFIGEANLISGNSGSGLVLTTTNASSNQVLTNYIGTDSNGTIAIGNNGYGVEITNGATLNTIGSPILANVISGNTAGGITITTEADSNTIIGNLIGTNGVGSSAIANAGEGIRVESASNIVGGSTAGTGNTISGNGLEGIAIAGVAATGNQVLGNTIGLASDGSTALANLTGGVSFSDASSNTLGGTTAGDRNVIAGNGGTGVLLTNTSTTLNRIVGNYIGTDVGGSAAVPNSSIGIRILGGANNNVIGDSAGTGGNLISGNGSHGIGIAGVGTDANSLVANQIGTDATGLVPLGNNNDGIHVSGGASSNIIGGSASGEGNVVSGNGNEGITIRDAGSNDNAILGNFIGTDRLGTAAIGNASHGIQLFSGPQNTRIGDSGTDEGNLIAANGGYGIVIESSNTTSNVVQGNVIGIDLGTTTTANNYGGIIIRSGANANQIGGDSTLGEGNVISGHTALVGVTIADAGSNSNTVLGNVIGTDSAGSSSGLGNGIGIFNQNAPDTVIGGTSAGEANLVSGNVSNGVQVGGRGSTDIIIYGNLIGTASGGATALGNGGHGVYVSGGAARVTIGSATPGSRNVIAANTGHGVLADASDEVTLIANHIGTGTAGTEKIGNGGDGVRLNNATASTIGLSTASGSGNLIVNNSGNGVGVEGANSADNALHRNLIAANSLLGIDLGVDGLTYNDHDDADTGANALQNTPVLSSVVTDESTSLQVLGTLDGEVSQGYRIELFSNSTPDPSGRGEAERFLGAFDTTTNAAGDSTLNASIGGIALAAGESVTATATRIISPGKYGDTSEFSVNILSRTNVDPVITSANSANVAENATPVLTVTSSDADTGDTGAYSIVGGTDSARFNIDAGTGELTFNSAPDFKSPTDSDTDNVYVVDLRVTDGAGATDTQTLSVTVTDANDNTPIITSANSANVAENSTTVLTVTSSDADTGDSAFYSITGGTDSARFSIGSGTGELTFASAPDFETPSDSNADNVHVVDIEVSDGNGATDTQTISVTVTDVNDNAPLITSASSANIAENSKNVLTVTASDADASDAASFSIVGGTDAARFAIDSGTGELTFVSAPDFETPSDSDTDNLYVIDVRVTDGAGATDMQAVIVTVTDLNDESPAITSANSADVAENSTAILTVASTDADPGDSAAYSIGGGTDAARFDIDGVTGDLTFTTAPDFETPTDSNSDNVYAVDIRVTDGAGATDTQNIQITVTDVNDGAPVITSANSANVVENSTAVLTVTSSDADAGDSAIYSIIGGADATLFTVNSASGALQFLKAPDFEAPTDANRDNRYDIVVQASDSNIASQVPGATVNQFLQIHVINDNEPPGSKAEPITASTGTAGVIGRVDMFDPDSGDLLSLQIIGGTLPEAFQVNSDNGEIRVREAVLPGTYLLELRISDAAGAFTDFTLEVRLQEDERAIAAAMPLAQESLPAIMGSMTSSRYTGEADTTNRASSEGVPAAEGDSTSEVLASTTDLYTHFTIGVPTELPPVQRSADADERLSSRISLLEPVSATRPTPLFEQSDGLGVIFNADGQLAQHVQEAIARLRSDIDTLVQEAQSDADMRERVSSIVSLSLTAGFVTWSLNAGYLLATSAATAPLWRRFDPIPVLGDLQGDVAATEPPDQAESR